MKNSTTDGYVLLSTQVLLRFDYAWTQAIIDYADEKEFNKLRKYFKDEKYEIFCGLCNIDAANWQKRLENIKTRAFADKNYYTHIKKCHEKKPDLKDEEELIWANMQ